MSRIPAPEPPEEEEDFTSRGDIRRAEKTKEQALSRLARDLASLREKQLDRLELPEDILDAVLAAKAIESPRARERQLRVVRGTLRDTQWAAIRARVEHLREHGTVGPTSAESSAAEHEWMVRLVGEGEKALDELVAARPDVDRKHIRQLVRTVARAGPERRKRAEAKLASTLKFLLERG